MDGNYCVMDVNCSIIFTVLFRVITVLLSGITMLLMQCCEWELVLLIHCFRGELQCYGGKLLFQRGC